MKYRREIDGLRAIAVLSVLFFHAGFNMFRGGFVGVDIFFVISGFLITSMIVSDLEDGRFSLKRFYERRVRRVVPALLVVCLVSSFISWKLMFPSQLEAFASNLIGVVTSTSNILFWKKAGYFAPDNNLNFLIHTWSLSVEEQYYLIFPLLIGLGWRFGKKKLFVFFCFVTTASFLLAQVGLLLFPSASFYLLPTRIWEILTGGIVALWVSTKSFRIWVEQRSLFILNLGSIVGLLAILIPVFIFSSATPNPSWYTLVPLLGTSLIIIFSQCENWIKTILSSRVLVGVGLISYSLYLWHQPIFAMGRLISILEPKSYEMIAYILVSIGLAYITWVMIELPFRDAARIKPKFLAIAVVSSASILLSFAFLVQKKSGFPDRFPALTRLVSSFPTSDELACFNLPTSKMTTSDSICKIGFKSSTPTIAIIGDSHVNRLSAAFSKKLKELGLASLVYSYSYCAPLIDFARFDLHGRWRMGCKKEMNSAFDFILNSPQIKTVILFAEWAYYTEGYRWGDPNFSTFSTVDLPPKSISENKQQFEKALKQTGLKLKLRGKNVVFIKSTPEYELRVPDVLAKLMITGRPLNLPENKLVTLEKYKVRNKNVEVAISKARLTDWADIVDPFEEFCGKGTCDYISANHVSLYEDDNHLSYQGAVRLVEHLFSKISLH